MTGSARAFVDVRVSFSSSAGMAHPCLPFSDRIMAGYALLRSGSGTVLLPAWGALGRPFVHSWTLTRSPLCVALSSWLEDGSQAGGGDPAVLLPEQPRGPAGQRPSGQVKVLCWHPLYWGVSLPCGDPLGQCHELPEAHSLLRTSCEVCAFSWG